MGGEPIGGGDHGSGEMDEQGEGGMEEREKDGGREVTEMEGGNIEGRKESQIHRAMDAMRCTTGYRDGTEMSRGRLPSLSLA